MGSKKEKTVEQTLKFVEMVAKKQGWKLNRDDEFLHMLAEGLMKNYNQIKISKKMQKTYRSTFFA